MKYARVIVDIAHSQVDRVFDYRLPEELAYISAGYRVQVPFGHTSTEGYVVEISDQTEVAQNKLKSVKKALDSYPALLPELIDLATEMKKTYHCLLVDALRCLLPAEMRAARVSQRVVKTIELAVPPEKIGVAMAGLARAPKQLAALNVLLSIGSAPAALLMEQSGTNLTIWRALEGKGLVSIHEERENRRPTAAKGIEPDQALLPNAQQQSAIDAIVSALHGPGQASFLIHGVTGCGKTEIYMQCAQEALRLGKGVLILVPEIALTPQMVRRFTARFGDTAAVLHSRLSAGERYDEWGRIRRREARVVVGARSAIFAPLEDVGLIVVDEEHEQSYRSETAPRYDAIEVAQMRCRQSGAVLVLGSATPSVERYWQAQMGQWKLLSIPNRIGTARLPSVQVVDMRRELSQGNRGVMSAALVKAMEECLSRGEQAIVLLNRRGYSSFVSCRNCGYVVKCDLCDVSMTYHKHSDTLRCHYCKEEKAVPATCPQCGSPYIRYFGDGTQKLQEELEQRFPGVKTLRMDADTTRGKDSHLAILDQFRRQECQVLVGTQMIAKGLDFPNVTLVGVVAVDTLLFLPDYKSSERAFQLMEQVAGRAGRGDKPGRVILQTYSPEHFAIRCAAAHDYTGFFQQEIAQRQATQYPPFGRLLRVLLSDEDEQTALEDARTVYRRAAQKLRARQELNEQVLFMDMTPAPVSRIRAQFRFQVVLKVTEQPYGRYFEDLLYLSMQELPGSSYAILESNPATML